ncbi:MAG TPA: DUF1080 domain-containing protein, partial [Saprospiraceae bacterium]|nr:DUF1080 domain-containing protein [Saprospiraceae bacterium]
KVKVKVKVLSFLLVTAMASCLKAQLPAGFKSIFNGKNLKGWHISRTNHQGTTPDVQVRNGVLELRQSPFGQGGVLLTNKQYSDFELYLEVNIDSFSNGGLFLRSNEGGAAYQVELALPGGTGDLLGERIPVSNPAKASGRENVWKPNDWNSFRIRMQGTVPKICLWINDRLIYEVEQTRNDFIAGATRGMVGLQCHWTALYSPAAESELMPLDAWRPGAVHRFRNIGIRKR